VKVGKYDIPQYKLYPKLVEATKTLFQTFKADEAPDLLTVAKLLGHKTDKSGGFLMKLADMRSYGLITSRGVKVTDLGKKLTYGLDDQEKNEAFKEALLNIPLWKEFYSKFGKTLPVSNFWANLKDITGLEAPDAQNVAEIVRNAYLDDAQYVKEAKKPENGDDGMDDQNNVDRNLPKTPEGLEQLTLGSSIKIWLPKDDKDAARKAIQLIKLYSGIEEED
jgi:hypothetical protein